MEDFKKRLVTEYQELVEKKDKLSAALQTEGFEEKVGKVQYFYMVTQYTGMRIYMEALADRLNDLRINYK